MGIKGEKKEAKNSITEPWSVEKKPTQHNVKIKEKGIGTIVHYVLQ